MTLRKIRKRLNDSNISRADIRKARQEAIYEDLAWSLDAIEKYDMRKFKHIRSELDVTTSSEERKEDVLKIKARMAAKREMEKKSNL